MMNAEGEYYYIEASTAARYQSIYSISVMMICEMLLLLLYVVNLFVCSCPVFDVDNIVATSQ
jgi:hypothetical protein